MECQLCHQLFSSQDLDHVPILTSCSHTMCSTCFSYCRSEQIPCPFCMQPFGLECSPNLSILSQLDSHSVPKCEVCTEEHLPTMKCLDCGEWMCDIASKFHSQSKMSKTHHQISVSDLATQNSLLKVFQPKICESHSQTFEFFDEEPDCQKLLCTKCAPLNHSGHVMKDLLDPSLWSQKIQSVRDLSEASLARMGEFRSMESLFSLRRQSLDQSRDRVLGQVKQTFEELRAALTIRERALEKRVEELYKSSLFSLSDHQDRAQVWLGQLELLQRCAEELSPRMTGETSESSAALNQLRDRSGMVDVCLLEASLLKTLDLTASLSQVPPVSPTEGLHFSLSVEDVKRMIEIREKDEEEEEERVDVKDLLASLGELTVDSYFLSSFEAPPPISSPSVWDLALSDSALKFSSDKTIVKRIGHSSAFPAAVARLSDAHCVFSVEFLECSHLHNFFKFGVSRSLAFLDTDSRERSANSWVFSDKRQENEPMKAFENGKRVGSCRKIQKGDILQAEINTMEGWVEVFLNPHEGTFSHRFSIPVGSKEDYLFTTTLADDHQVRIVPSSVAFEFESPLTTSSRSKSKVDSPTKTTNSKRLRQSSDYVDLTKLLKSTPSVNKDGEDDEDEDY